MNAKWISSVISLLAILIIVSVYAAIINVSNQEKFYNNSANDIQNVKAVFYTEKNFGGDIYEITMSQSKHLIPRKWIGKFKSVQVPDMYAIYAASNHSAVRIIGNVPDLAETLNSLSQWKGDIAEVIIVGYYIKGFPQRDFKGSPMYLLSNDGFYYGRGGPDNAEQAKTFVKNDVGSFIVPHGLQVVLLSTVDGKIKADRFVAGSYHDSMISDDNGTQLIITSNKY